MNFGRQVLATSFFIFLLGSMALAQNAPANPYAGIFSQDPGVRLTTYKALLDSNATGAEEIVKSMREDILSQTRSPNPQHRVLALDVTLKSPFAHEALFDVLPMSWDPAQQIRRIAMKSEVVESIQRHADTSLDVYEKLNDYMTRVLSHQDYLATDGKEFGMRVAEHVTSTDAVEVERALWLLQMARLRSGAASAKDVYQAQQVAALPVQFRALQTWLRLDGNYLTEKDKTLELLKMNDKFVEAGIFRNPIPWTFNYSIEQRMPTLPGSVNKGRWAVEDAIILNGNRFPQLTNPGTRRHTRGRIDAINKLRAGVSRSTAGTRTRGGR